jgi:hypothetical protein
MSVGHDIALESRRIGDMRRRVSEHKARLNRLIVQGTPTQFMEDALRKMEAGLRALQERRYSPGAHREDPEPGFPAAASRKPAGPACAALPSRSSGRAAQWCASPIFTLSQGECVSADGRVAGAMPAAIL